ncbi:MAG: glycoside hydrolase family 3 protein [Candidatus Eremiobacteraeota bacterium]|nr:glycoside hydrolase family 3 protein [Candidatus Eremiobacteraeota bacterium]
MLIDTGEYIKKMSLDEKAGQLMLVTVPEKEIDKEWEEHLRKNIFAGVLFTRENLDNEVQTRDLIDSVQSIYEQIGTGMPSLISIQQEGGVADSLLFGKVVSPGNMAIGATRNSEFAYEAARLSAEELKSYGFNLVLAPVLDINSTPFNPAIGARSFSENEDLVIQMGIKAVRGYQENGLACCGKHFPGIGAITQDPEQMLPTLMHSERRFMKEIKPFESTIKQARLEAVMTGHVSYPIVVRDGKPATLSGSLIGFNLRNQMSFRGLTISDFICKGAITENHKVEEAVLLAVKAGVDIVLFGPDKDIQEKAHKALKDAIQSGVFSEDRLETSLQRIVRQKHRRNQMRYPMRENPAHMISKIARASVTLIKNDEALLPLRLDEEDYIGVIQPEFPHLDMPTFGEMLTSKYPWVDEFQYDMKDFEIDMEELKERMSDCEVIVFGTYHNGLIPDHQVEWIKALKELDKPIIGLAMNNPYHLIQYNDYVRASILTYGSSHYSLEAAADILLGKLSPRGQLPITLPDICEYGYSLTF